MIGAKKNIRDLMRAEKDAEKAVFAYVDDLQRKNESLESQVHALRELLKQELKGSDTDEWVDALQQAFIESTQGEWQLTKYSGGMSFNGPQRAICGKDPHYGEPMPMPNTEADNRFIVIAHNRMPDILALLRKDRE